MDTSFHPQTNKTFQYYKGLGTTHSQHLLGNSLGGATIAAEVWVLRGNMEGMEVLTRKALGRGVSMIRNNEYKTQASKPPFL